jgi:hypothetical protein
MSRRLVILGLSAVVLAMAAAFPTDTIGQTLPGEGEGDPSCDEGGQGAPSCNITNGDYSCQITCSAGYYACCMSTGSSGKPDCHCNAT